MVRRRGKLTFSEALDELERMTDLAQELTEKLNAVPPDGKRFQYHPSPRYKIVRRDVQEVKKDSKPAVWMAILAATAGPTWERFLGNFTLEHVVAFDFGPVWDAVWSWYLIAAFIVGAYMCFALFIKLLE